MEWIFRIFTNFLCTSYTSPDQFVKCFENICTCLNIFYNVTVNNDTAYFFKINYCNLILQKVNLKEIKRFARDESNRNARIVNNVYKRARTNASAVDA